jgi:hypothetical protein
MLYVCGVGYFSKTLALANVSEGIVMDPDMVRQQEEEEAASRSHSRLSPIALARAGLTVTSTPASPEVILQGSHGEGAASLSSDMVAASDAPSVPKELAISTDKAASQALIPASVLPVLISERPRFAKRQMPKRPIWFATFFNVLFVAAGIVAGVIIGVKEHLSPLHEFFVCAGLGYVVGLYSAVDWLRRSCQCTLWRAVGVALWPIAITWITQLMSLALATYFAEAAWLSVGGVGIPAAWVILAAGVVASYFLALPSMLDTFRQMHPHVRA